MPELPEVETVAQGLRASLVGYTITGVEVRWARSVIPPDPDAFTRQLTGRTVTGVIRRGKWVVIELSGDGALLVHLRMTGQLVLEPAGSPDDRYVRVLFALGGGWRLRFSDMRKFGRLWLVDDPVEALNDLGPEPLA
jgi:formamidopyrimidine-DNA glycosylase